MVGYFFAFGVGYGSFLLLVFKCDLCICCYTAWVGCYTFRLLVVVCVIRFGCLLGIGVWLIFCVNSYVLVGMFWLCILVCGWFTL